MSLDYEQNTQDFEAVVVLIDRYIDWYSQIITAIAFPNDVNVDDDVVRPTGLMDWVHQSLENGTVAEDVLDNLVEIHKDLMAASEIVIQMVSSADRPDYSAFINFKTLFEAFTGRMRRLERDSLSEGAGFDERTGLRNKKALYEDLKKEMELVGRRGSPFSMILTRIDSFSQIEDKDEAERLVAANIKKCIRTFDDAYYLDEGTFLISLKQADIISAQVAITRLQSYMRTDSDNRHILTLSYCMTEPVPGDDAKSLLENMRADLIAYEDEHDVVLKFVEVSPLQRYVDSMDTQ